MSHAGSRRAEAAALAIVPARGGSKRFPRKNLAPLAGVPLVTGAITAARTSELVGRVIVSTDDEEIASTSRQAGAEVPWLRPPELSGDEVPTVAVLRHVLQRLEADEGSLPPIAVLLEPTAPMRQPAHIDAAIRQLRASACDSVVSVSPVPHIHHPDEVLVCEKGRLRPFASGRTLDDRRLRGAQTPVYSLNGAVYAFRPATLLETGCLFGTAEALVLGPECLVDIDTELDLVVAESLLKAGGRR
jgi:CMP-N-acetylneuraminic acid synthetase